MQKLVQYGEKVVKMGQYKADKIINIAVAGHGGCGKTTLSESMLFVSGKIEKTGKVSSGNTVCDYDNEEIKRLASMSLAVAPFTYKDYKINLLDTPGMFDFSAGLYEGIFAADSVLITLSGKSGVTVGAKKAYDAAKKNNKPRAFFISKLDADNSSFFKVLEDLKTQFGPSICPLTVPFYDNFHEGVLGYVDLISMKAYLYDDAGKSSPCALPESEHRLEGLVAAISEAVAETDEELFEKYFSGEAFTQAELIKGIKTGMKNGTLSPVFCGSGLLNTGVDMMLDGIVNLFPTAIEAQLPENEEMAELKCSESDPLCAYVFKTIADPFIGKMTFFKVISGVLKSDSSPINCSTGEPEKISKLMYIFGKKQTDTKEIVAGDIGVAAKLNANTGDTICDASRKIKINPIEFPEPCYRMAIVMNGNGDESKISSGIHRMLEEDGTLGFEINDETHEQILSGLGDQHLDVVIAKLKSKFGVDISLKTPTIAYRETIRKTVKAEGKHKKQTGGHGQFGHVVMSFEPCDGDEILFDDCVFGGAVPKGYFPAVEKGIRESAMKGVLAGYPMVGMKATLCDGSYHPVDSSEMAFKMAASLAYREGIPNASPILLEPIGSLKAYIPDANTGDIMGELNKRRGRVLGMNPVGDGITLIEAEAPESEMQDFSMFLRQMTQGAGWFSFGFVRYEQLPNQLEAKVIENSKHHE